MELPPAQSTVLVVDDEGEIREFLCEILASEDYDIRSAASAEEALKILESGWMPGLVLLDLRMPGMGGHGLLEAIRKREEYLPIPVLVLTALPGIEPLLKSYELGADDYLSKPFHPAELVARVRAKFRHPRGLAVDLDRLAPAVSESGASEEVALGDCRLRVNSREILMADGRRKLRESEFKILNALLTSQIGWRTREELAQALWTHITPEKVRALDPHISSLRKKLEGTGVVLETHYGRGYQLRNESSASQTAVGN